MATEPGTTFIALYRGRTPSDARLIAVSAEPELVAIVVGNLLRSAPRAAEPILTPMERGRHRTLLSIARELADPSTKTSG